jgi:hypothetical protein
MACDTVVRETPALSATFDIVLMAHPRLAVCKSICKSICMTAKQQWKAKRQDDDRYRGRVADRVPVAPEADQWAATIHSLRRSANLLRERGVTASRRSGGHDRFDGAKVRVAVELGR